MRIATWNVNGLRSVVRRDFDDWLRQTQYDVVCLQEVKVAEDLLTTHWFDGYEAYWNSSERPGHSGVATLVRHGLKVDHVLRGIDHPDSDPEGRVLAVDVNGIRIVNIYAPHSHRQLLRLDAKMAFLGALTSFIARQNELGQKLVLLGDFNIAHREIDLANPKANAKNAGFLPQERAWLDQLLNEGFTDAFRSLTPDPDHYTWWSMRGDVRERNVGWRLDYAIISNTLLPRLRGCEILSSRLGSDHCPVLLTMSAD